MTPYSSSESSLSQLPALALLNQLGWTTITPAEALAQRQGKPNQVLLEGILRDQLKALNRISYKGGEYRFSEENIQTAIQKLKAVKYDGLVRTNEVVYDLLTLGTSLEQTIEGDTRSFDLAYIAKNPERNTYHVCSEFTVERQRSNETARPDLVLFVNGIPLAVIECKAPDVEVSQAVSQMVRNQTDEFIPKLFTFVQLVVAVNKNQALYATTGTAAKFWGVWKESGNQEAILRSLLGRDVTEQDKALHSLCRPERLVDLAFRFTLFDGGVKKIARYQQYFVVHSTLNRVKKFDAEGRRQGGLIWQTQGSGKSLTMVLLARSLALDSGVTNPRIVLVTDRDDLDKQLANTFRACGLEPDRATSGRNLLDLISEGQAAIVTTLVHKFDKALNVRKHIEESPDIFLLVDEAHRSHYKTMQARMRQMLPNACYVGFTGTPLLKAERNSFAKFGSLIEPAYSIAQAVEDKAVVPLLYEGRHVEMEQNQQAIDLWFDRYTQGLSSDQKADLKRKYARAEMLSKTEQVVYMRAFDISEHYRQHMSGHDTGLKGQVVAPTKAMAVLYKKFLDEIGLVTSEVVISPPDQREGYEETDEPPTDEVQLFWTKMMKRYGDEDKYTAGIINQFKNGEEPELIVVCSKLLTGFDAPRNTFLYLCRTLEEHNLLQAIARVNRLWEGKEFGYIIDYQGVLGKLDEAMGLYGALSEYDPADVAQTLTDVRVEVDKLPQRHSDLWDLFKTIRNKSDEEAYERLLGDEDLRQTFYARLSDYSKTLGIALSTQHFLETTGDSTMARYKGDLLRFQKLRKAVKLRYAEAVDYKDYEPKIKKLLDTHIQAHSVYQLNEPVNIFDDQAFSEVKESQGVYGTQSVEARADTMAHAVKKAITEHLDEDPAFYEKFSKLIQLAIDDFRAQRISALEYLKQAADLRERVVSRKHDDLPATLEGREDAQAYYGVAAGYFESTIAAEVALAVDTIFDRHWKVQFWDDTVAQNAVKNDIDDFLFDVVKGQHGVVLDLPKMDEFLEKTLQVARHRRRS